MYEEFVSWARCNREMMRAMERLQDVSAAAVAEGESDDDAEEVGAAARDGVCVCVCMCVCVCVCGRGALPLSLMGWCGAAFIFPT